MKQCPVLIVVLYTILLSHSLSAQQTITASQFNATYSCQNPLIVNQTTIIELDEDIVITQSCELIQPGPQFNLITDRVIFTATNNNRVVINNGVMWSFRITMEFMGNAQCTPHEGAIVNFINSSLLFNEHSIFMPI